MTTDLDGTAIDLDHVQVALDGSRWLWTCELTGLGDALMANLDDPRVVLPLPTMVLGHGVIAPERQPTTAAMYRQVLEATS